MGVATVSFHKYVLNSESDGSQDGRLASRVIFDLDIDGKNYKDVYVMVSELPNSGNHGRLFEISQIHGYEGPLNYEVLKGSIEFYLRQVMGGKESALNAPGKILGLSDWTFEQEMVVQFEMPGSREKLENEEKIG